MSLRITLLALVSVLLQACDGSGPTTATPREPGPDATGYYCRMLLKEHAGPKGQILRSGAEAPLWFSSVKDALTYVDQETVGEREIAGFWVNDMGQGTWEKPAPGSWIDAPSAHFVVGSRKTGGMGGTEAVPFRERRAAEAFVGEHGGRVVDYATARRSMADATQPDADAGGGT
jgi:copper chaperone NosL